MKHLVFLFLLFCFLVPSPAEDSRDMEWYIQEALDAAESERYEYAVKILTEGGEVFPDASVFPAMLGELYYEKELYSLAVKEYERARKRSPEDFEVLYSLATIQGMLNRDLESTATLEEILTLYPDSLDVIIDLGWMYFKTFQLARGEKILKEALETYGTVPGLAMTLGTVYSGMYQYDEAKKYYLDSIDAALETGRSYFASVAYYNLSLLEQNFYHYNDALDATRRSLQMAERASGRIALGELYQLKADYPGARAEYEKAFSLDTTPLAMMNLADLHLESGDPHQALAYLEEVRNTADTSWMFYFGTDIKRHRLELHRIYEDIYRSLAFEAFRIPRRGLKRLSVLPRYLGYRALSWYHGRRYKSLCLEVGMSHLEDGNVLDGNWFFYRGNKDYKKIAMKYLIRTEKFETAIAPEAAPWYLLERGKLLGDPDYLFSAIEALKTDWERGGRVEALALLSSLIGKKRPADNAILMKELYHLNPGAFSRFGLTLPVLVEGDVPGALRRLLNRSWFTVVRKPEEAAFTLSLTRLEGGEAAFGLKDPATGELKATGTSPRSPFRRKDHTGLVEDVIAKVFDIE